MNFERGKPYFQYYKIQQLARITVFSKYQTQNRN